MNIPRPFNASIEFGGTCIAPFKLLFFGANHNAFIFNFAQTYAAKDPAMPSPTIINSETFFLHKWYILNYS